MTLKAELPVFSEGVYTPPEPKNRNTPPPGRQILANTPPPGNFGHSRCLETNYRYKVLK